MKTNEMNTNQLIAAILDEANKRDVVSELVLDFMKKGDPVIFKLDEMVTDILHTTLVVAYEQLIDAKMAVAAAMTLIDTDSNDKEEMDDFLKLTKLAHICKSFAPKGKLESWAVPTQKKIFEMLLKLFRDPNVFSFDKTDDVETVKIAGCWDYLQLVDKENPKN